jgi:hypothetical protein
MSRATLSIVAFGLYLIGLGVILVILPNPAIGLLGLPPTEDVWLRIAGFLAAAIGYYYLQAARNGVRLFYRWTVHARALVPPLFAAFVLFKLARPMLLIFAAVDAAGALWTWLALRSDERGAR